MEVTFWSAKRLSATELIDSAKRTDLTPAEGRALAAEIGARYSAFARLGMTWAGLDEALINARNAAGLNG